MQVRELATESVVTCDVDDSLATAGRQMLEEHVGSVVVTRDGDPAGILTETDALRAGVATDRPFDDVAVHEVASSPLETVTPTATVREAVRQMQRHDVKHLPVVEQLELRGIVTMSDVVFAYTDIVREARDADSRRDRWETDADRWQFDDD
ncbi:CBS domain-containing protein [Halobaculum sp. MBLA0147]|uniref:CBS domain-containing protein n=1 Tax=Halobaculum sp. MBLA0147 TaxID=3079934 RepID=UPI003524C5C3